MVKLRAADAMRNAGKDLAAVLQSLGVSEATLHRWRAQYGGMKSEETKRLKQLASPKKPPEVKDCGRNSPGDSSDYERGCLPFG